MELRLLGERAINMLGAAVGGGIGAYGGPVGAIKGAVIGAAFTDTLKDVANRMLSDREKIRVDNSSVYIAEGVIEKWKNGEIVRQDGFFEGDANFTNNGAELLEGILMKCKEQYQEKKVHFISNIFKNVAFNPTITARAAYQTLSLAESLTYQKVCMLSYYGRKSTFSTFQIMNDPMTWYQHVKFSSEMEIAVQDLLEMHNQGILTNQFGMTSSDSVSPGTMELTARGRMAFHLMDLQQVESSDVLEALMPLEYQESWGESSSGTINGRYKSA